MFPTRCHYRWFAITDTFSHEVGDGGVKDGLWDAGVVGHGVLLHLFERRELHDLVDDLVRERKVQVLHDSHHFPTRILWASTQDKTRSFSHQQHV